MSQKKGLIASTPAPPRRARARAICAGGVRGRWTGAGASRLVDTCSVVKSGRLAARGRWRAFTKAAAGASRPSLPTDGDLMYLHSAWTWAAAARCRVLFSHLPLRRAWSVVPQRRAMRHELLMQAVTLTVMQHTKSPSDGPSAALHARRRGGPQVQRRHANRRSVLAFYPSK